MSGWQCVLTLDSERNLVDGGEEQLAAAIRRGADLRIQTAFRHNEHIDVTSDSNERVVEVAEFGVTYLIDDAWVAGIMSLRQPIALPLGFGPRPSMSFFLYNQDGQQAIARPHLDGVPATGQPGPSPPEAPDNMPKYHTLDSWDGDTNAPSSNFIYDFDVYRFCAHDCWTEVLSHDADGAVQSGSLAALIEAFEQGCEVKVGVGGLCDDLAADAGRSLQNELFVQAGPGYYYTEKQLFLTGTHPIIRVKPAVPMRYESHGWDFGWLQVRTDGRTVYRRCDPYTLAFADRQSRCAVRWFVR